MANSKTEYELMYGINHLTQEEYDVVKNALNAYANDTQHPDSLRSLAQKVYSEI